MSSNDFRISQGTPATEEGTPATEEGTPATEEGTPATEERAIYYLLFLFPRGNSIGFEEVFCVLDRLKKIKENPEKVEIRIVIDSSGGDPYSAFKIIEIIRKKCSVLKAIIPFRAKSAATLMTFGCDEIIMSPQSELGPLDMPYEHPLLAGKTISANDVINSLNHIHKTSRELAFEHYNNIKNEVTGVSNKQALEIGINWSVDLIKPLLEKEDPRVVHECLRLLNIAEIYGKELLKKYMFREYDNYSKNSESKSIVKKFIYDFPDHSFAIFRETARNIGLKIIDSENFTDWNCLWYNYKQIIMDKDYKGVTIILSQSEFNQFCKAK